MTHVDHPTGSLRTGNVADELATAAGPMRVVVVTPARPIHDGEATHVAVESEMGQLGVWPRHCDLVAALGVGPLRIGHGPDREEKFAIWGGFLKVGGGKVTILVDRAVRASEVDPAQVRQELDETLAALRHPRSDEEFRTLLDRRRWCQARLRIA